MAVSRRPTVEYVPIFSDTAEEAPPEREKLEPNGRPVESREAQIVKKDAPLVNVEEPEPYITSVTPEPERNDEHPAILGPIVPTPSALEPKASGEPPAATYNRDPIQAPVEPKMPEEPPATMGEADLIPPLAKSNEQREQNVDNPTVPVSPLLESATAGRASQVGTVSVEQHGRQLDTSFGQWSSTLLEIKQRIEPLASDTLEKLPQLDQVCVSMLGSCSTSLPRHRESQSTLLPFPVSLCAYSCTARPSLRLTSPLPMAFSDHPPPYLTIPLVISKGTETSRSPRPWLVSMS